MSLTITEQRTVSKAVTNRSIWSNALTATLVLVVAASLGAITPGYADRTEAVQLVQEAQQLLDEGKHPEARKKLAEALQADPSYPEAHANLGYLHEVSGEIEEALDRYGLALKLAPDHTYSRGRMRQLFYTARFPRWIKLDYLKYSPLSVVVDRCQIKLPADSPTAPARRFDFAYTTSLLFPEEMGRNDPALRIPIPAAGRDTGVYAIVNRVSYGMIRRPNSPVLDLRFVVQYPSRTISQSDRDYTQLAATVTHLLLRFSGYAATYLNRPPTGDNEGLVHVYLCESGPAGAEQYENNIYLYDIDLARTAAEWTREVAHELGHYLLPAVGQFDEPEKLGNGLLGERLFLQWLAAEAELVSGAPWPSQETSTALSAVLSGDAQKVADYVQEQCRPALDLWLREGPDSPLLGAKSAEAMDYFTGFCLWVLAAHGPEVLAEVFDNTPGENPVPVDCVAAYREIVTRSLDVQPWRVNAGALNLAESQLSQPVREGALRREEITISPGDFVVLPVYLPAGTWQVSALASPSADTLTLELKLDQGTLVGLTHLTVSTAAPGWHTIRISTAQASEALRFEGLQIELSPQA